MTNGHCKVFFLLSCIVYLKMYVYKRIVDAKLFIDTHYGDEVNLGQIADSAHFSKFHFLRLFKKAYGLSPHQYLIQVRLHEARKLIDAGYSIQASCQVVGFDSPSSFTHRFKRIFGISPRSYQRSIIQKRNAIKITPYQYIPGCFASQFASTK